MPFMFFFNDKTNYRNWERHRMEKQSGLERIVQTLTFSNSGNCHKPCLTKGKLYLSMKPGKTGISDSVSYFLCIALLNTVHQFIKRIYIHFNVSCLQ